MSNKLSTPTPSPWYILGEDRGGDEVPYLEIAKGECGYQSFRPITHVRAEDLRTLSDEDRANAILIVTAVNAMEPTKAALKRAEKELLWASEQFEGGEVLRLAAAECRAALLLGEA